MILISEKENKYEKYWEERHSREITKGFKMGRRKKAGLILSGIGGTIYLLASLMGSYILTYFGGGPLPFIITGVISLTGTGIGVKNIKKGGIIILISIPLSLVIGIIFSGYFHIAYLGILLLFSQPHFVFVIIGGILCLKSSDSRIEGVDPRITILKEEDWKSVIGRAGPILTLIGAILFLIDGAFWVIMLLFIVTVNTIRFYELMCGIIGILGIYFGFKHKEFARFLCLIAGILGVAGLIIPFPTIGYWYLAPGMLTLFPFIFLDYIVVFLFLIGGLLSVASENRYLNYYLEKVALKNSFDNIEEDMDNIEDGGRSFEYERK